ncbi:MAG: GxxExxY protein [Gemmatimonadetes bacterium]|nr:GxxExxY protein [Gemmatimonadota bacterium]
MTTEYGELTEGIIGCAYQKGGLEASSRRPIVVRYDDEVVGEFVADIVVENTIIVELKSVRRLLLSHEVQLVNYLVATGKPVGLLLNFGETKVEVRRKVRELRRT